ncbi:MAG: hypothetical protein WBA13_09510 [Microcoleaceae cyanobacterium]
MLTTDGMLRSVNIGQLSDKTLHITQKLMKSTTDLLFQLNLWRTALDR